MSPLKDLRGVFSTETNRQGSDVAKGGLTREEVANRLYPRPAEPLRRDEPGAAANKDASKDENAAPAASSDVAGATQTPSPSESAVGTKKEEPVAAIRDEAAPTLSVVSPNDGKSDTVTLPAPAAVKAVSVISRSSVFDGNYQSDGDVNIEGEVRGEITCKGHILICEGAKVNAKISATSVAVAGSLSGEVNCNERFEALPTAKITSQVKTPQLVIQEGACFDGQISMSKNSTPA